MMDHVSNVVVNVFDAHNNNTSTTPGALCAEHQSHISAETCINIFFIHGRPIHDTDTSCLHASSDQGSFMSSRPVVK